MRRGYRACQVRDEDADYRRHLRGFSAHDYSKRIPAKSPGLAEAIMQVAHVVLLNKIWIVSEHSNHRRRCLHLRGIVQLDLTPCCLRRLAATDDLLERRVHLRCADTFVPLGVDLEEQLENFRHPLSTQRGSKYERHELQKR